MCLLPPCGQNEVMQVEQKAVMTTFISASLIIICCAFDKSVFSFSANVPAAYHFPFKFSIFVYLFVLFLEFFIPLGLHVTLSWTWMFLRYSFPSLSEFTPPGLRVLLLLLSALLSLPPFLSTQYYLTINEFRRGRARKNMTYLAAVTTLRGEPPHNKNSRLSFVHNPRFHSTYTALGWVHK